MEQRSDITRYCLVVEDEALTRYAFSRTLEKLHYRVFEAEDALEAYGMVLRFQQQGLSLDFILLDLYLPSMNGIELIDRLQNDEITIPLLVTSGFLSPALRAKLHLRHQTHLLSKPFRPQQLIDLVQLINNSANGGQYVS